MVQAVPARFVNKRDKVRRCMRLWRDRRVCCDVNNGEAESDDGNNRKSYAGNKMEILGAGCE